MGVGHVLRYTDFFKKNHQVIKQGLLGEIINITLAENLTLDHVSHSYVRGIFSNSKEASPMILSKCCHDLDLLYWMVDSLPERITSSGNRFHFKKENVPDGSPEYCVEGCPIEDKCLYNAEWIYMDLLPLLRIIEQSDNRLYKAFARLKKHHANILIKLSKLMPPLRNFLDYRGWPVNMIFEKEPSDHSQNSIKKILRTSRYGKCVYKCKNDIVDHQIVNILFENGVTGSLLMHGFSHQEGRTIRIDATKATLIGEFFTSGEKITVYDHHSGKHKIIFRMKLTADNASHGGGDHAFIEAFLKTVNEGGEYKLLTAAEDSLESHFMAFAAEDARINDKMVSMKEFREHADHI